MCLYMTLRSDPCIISFQNMQLVVRCQRKILIAIAADESMQTVVGAAIAAPAQLPQSVSFGTWILRPLDPHRGTITGSDSVSDRSAADVTVLWCAGASRRWVRPCQCSSKAAISASKSGHRVDVGLRKAPQ